MLNKGQLFESLLDSSSDILIFFDASLRIKEMNAEAKKIFLPTNKKDLNLDLIDLLIRRRADSLFVETLRKIIKGIKKNGLPKTIFSYRNKEYIVDWKILSLPQEPSENKLFLLRGINITKHYQLSQKIEEFENIFSSLPGVVFLKDKNLDYVNFNNNFLKFSGFTDRKEVIGKNDFDFPWKDYAREFRENDRTVLQSGETLVDVDNSIPVDKGIAVDVISNKAPFKDKKGNIVGVIGIAMEISEQKKYEKALESLIQKEKIIKKDKVHDLQEIGKELTGFDIELDQLDKTKQILIFLKTIIASMPGNVYWKNLDSVYMGGNDNVVKVCNLSSRADIAGITDSYLEEKLHWEPGTAARFKQDDVEVIESKVAKTFEDIFFQADGKKVVMLTTKAPIFSTDGQVIGILATSLDITQLKQQEIDLQHAKETAEASNHTKTDFLSNMSHDVKTPLSGMISLAEILSFRVQAELQDLTQDLMDAGKQLMSFFENCIELSKIENHSLIVSKENFNLKGLMYELLQLFRPAIVAKNLSLYIEYSENIPTRLLGSRANLYRVLLNLIGNAIKFTHQGSIKITANLSQKSTDKRAIIQLKITDTGVGIPREKQGFVFEKFSRLTPSFQGNVEGHGIGLYIVQQFIESMDGQISVKSEEGKGSDFILAIPFEYPLLADGEYEKDDNEDDLDLNLLQVLPQEKLVDLSIQSIVETINPSSQKILADTSKPAILLVEDDVRAQMVARILLEGLGCQVDVAGCGEKAIALFKSGKYSLIFMDIGLPDMKGYQVAKHLREAEKNTAFHVPILGLSAHASQEEKQLSVDAGMEAMLSKPLLMDQAKKNLECYVFSKSVA